MWRWESAQPHRQGFQGSELQVRIPHGIACEAQPRISIQERREKPAQFHAGDAPAQAGMRTDAKGQMPLAVGSVEVELVGLLEHPEVAICRADEERHRLVLLNA